MLATVEQGLFQTFEKGEVMGDLRAYLDCPRLVRLLLMQIIGFRILAERDVPTAQVKAWSMT